MDETNVQTENSNQVEEVALETTEEAVTSEETTEESVEDIKSRLAKAEELANNYKIRAEKAEKNAKKVVTQTQTVQPKALSTKDLMALVENKVAEDDISEVEDYAKFKGISVSEALKTSTVKSLLAERRENRNVASATNTGPARRSPAKLSDDALIGKAQKGDMPESDEDIVRLIKARKGIK